MRQIGVGAAAGGDEAFVDFVRAQTPSLYRTAFLLTRNGLSAEELLQDTLVKLYPRWDRVEAAESVVAYVRRSLINAFLTTQRRPSSHDLGMWALPDRPDDTDPAATVVDRTHLWQLLGTLPERQRAALVLRYFHDLTDAEIATAIECRPATVRSLISRGLRSLQSTNAGHADGGALDASDPSTAAPTRAQPQAGG